MFPASLAACVPVFMATPTSACASAGASLVPSPVIATRRPPRCSSLMSVHLVLGRGLGEEVVDAGFLGDDRRGARVVAGDHHRADAHAPQIGEPLGDAGLHDVLQVDHAERARREGGPSAPASATTSGVPALRRDRVDGVAELRPGTRRPVPRPSAAPIRRRPCAPRRSSKSTPLMRVCAVNGDERRRRPARARGCRSAPWPAPRSSALRASRRRGSRAARRRPAPARVTPLAGTNASACRLPKVMVPVLSSSSVAQSPAASTARPLIASTLRRTSRSIPAMPIAESSAPIVVGIRHTSSATRIDDRLLGVGEHRERLQRDGREQEDDREPGEQDVEGDLVRCLLPRRALDEGDHAVDERLARSGGDPHHDLVGEHAGAAGDRRAVAARLADHRRRLAGDRRLVDAGDALDRPRRRSGSPRPRPPRTRRRDRARCSARPRCVPSGRRRWATVSERVLRSVSACALPRPSAIASAKLANSTVNQRNSATRPVNTFSFVVDEPRSLKNRTVVRTEPTADHEHHRVAHQRARVELDEAVADRPPDDLGLDELGVPGHQRTPIRGRAARRWGRAQGRGGR